MSSFFSYILLGDKMISLRTKNYLSPNTYNINFYDDKIYISNYRDIDCISEKLLIIDFITFKLKIIGDSFSIIKLLDKESLFKGKVKKVEFEHI